MTSEKLAAQFAHHPIKGAQVIRGPLHGALIGEYGAEQTENKRAKAFLARACESPRKIRAVMAIPLFGHPLLGTLKMRPKGKHPAGGAAQCPSCRPLAQNANAEARISARAYEK